jgi:hypothetical protein
MRVREPARQEAIFPAFPSLGASDPTRARRALVEGQCVRLLESRACAVGRGLAAWSSEQLRAAPSSELSVEL